jgi:hypothetical protein
VREFYAAARASWRGSAGFTVLVGCVCGRRLYLPRRRWLRRGFAICDWCRAVIVSGSLLVLSPEDVEEFMAGVMRGEEERAALRDDVERELRRFVQVYDTQPEWLWSPATVKLVQAVRPKLELLGGPIGRAEGGRRAGATPEAACQPAAGEDEGEDWLGEEEDAA